VLKRGGKLLVAFLGEVNSRDNTVGNGVRAGGVPVWV